MSRGLTIIETLIALLMLSLLIINLLGLLGALLVNATKTSDSGAGIYAAQYLLEQASSTGPPSPPGGISEGVLPLLNHESKIPVPFHYRLEWTKIGDPAQLASSGRNVQFAATLYHVTATIWWEIDNPESTSNQGGGRRTVSLERIIKVGKT